MRAVLEEAARAGDLSRAGIAKAVTTVGVVQHGGLTGNYTYGPVETREPPRVTSVRSPRPRSSRALWYGDLPACGRIVPAPEFPAKNAATLAAFWLHHAAVYAAPNSLNSATSIAVSVESQAASVADNNAATITHCA